MSIFWFIVITMILGSPFMFIAHQLAKESKRFWDRHEELQKEFEDFKSRINR